MTAGHNALRGSGPDHKLAFDNALAQAGCPDRRSTGSALRAVRPPNRHLTPDARVMSLSRERDRFPVAFAPGHDRPRHSGDLVGERDGCDLCRSSGQQRCEPRSMPGSMDFGIADDGQCAGREQVAQIAIASLANVAEPVLAAARGLFGHEADPGREVPP